MLPVAIVSCDKFNFIIIILPDQLHAIPNAALVLIGFAGKCMGEQKIHKLFKCETNLGGIFFNKYNLPLTT